MARTNIDIDDELVERVMRRYGLRTKNEAVNFALRKVAGPRWIEWLRDTGSPSAKVVGELRADPSGSR
ncbi:type II toxin-antitoxin system VapB family antitoxin [Amycolatopsis lurida]